MQQPFLLLATQQTATATVCCKPLAGMVKAAGLISSTSAMQKLLALTVDKVWKVAEWKSPSANLSAVHVSINVPPKPSFLGITF